MDRRNTWNKVIKMEEAKIMKKETWVKAGTLGVPDLGPEYRIRVVNNVPIIERRVIEDVKKWHLINSECKISIHRSINTDGYYLRIYHNGRSICALSLDNREPYWASDANKKRYKITPATHSTISSDIWEMK